MQRGLPSRLALAGACLGLALGALALGVVGLSPAWVPGVGSPYVPLSPYQLIDASLTGGPLDAEGTLDVTVAGVDRVAADAVAVVLNVTVTAPTATSQITVYPAGGSIPTIANLSFSSGETVTSLTIAPIGTDGQIAISNATGTVQVAVDLEGYFAADSRSSTAGSYVPLTPATIVDTRPGSGEPDAGNPLTPGASLDVQTEGQGGVPRIGVLAVALRVAVTDTTQSSSLTAFPAGEVMPSSSNLDWVTGETVANQVITPVGSDGEVSFYNAEGDADLVVDVVGFFTDGLGTPSNASLYIPIAPVRVLDTRSDAGTLEPGGYLAEQFAGVDEIGPTADAVVANVTSADATQPSLLGVLPEQVAGATAAVSVGASQTGPDLMFAALNADGGASIYNGAGTADAVVDVFGYFEPEGTPGASAVLPCSSASLVANASTDPWGTPVLADATATCPSGARVSYEYWYRPWYSSVWLLARGWGTADSYSYDTSTWAVGPYHLAVWASSGTSYQSTVATTALVSEPAYQYIDHVIPTEVALTSYMVDPANLETIAGCYAEWSAGANCGEDGIPGQCTFWAEMNWDSPYSVILHGNAAQLPRSYTRLTRKPVATTPAVGDLAVWDGPGPYADGSAGHIAVVTAVAADDSFYTVSQMNWDDLNWDISTMNVPFSASLAASQHLLGFLPPG
ncbi:MAG: CHAP domain-containing protein [Candidatus Dormibacteria bacterium]